MEVEDPAKRMEEEQPVRSEEDQKGVLRGRQGKKVFLG